MGTIWPAILGPAAQLGVVTGRGAIKIDAGTPVLVFGCGKPLAVSVTGTYIRDLFPIAVNCLCDRRADAVGTCLHVTGSAAQVIGGVFAGFPPCRLAFKPPSVIGLAKVLVRSVIGAHVHLGLWFNQTCANEATQQHSNTATYSNVQQSQ